MSRMDDSLRRREIRADYNAATIVVYQAYRKEIALAALAAGRFVSPFSLNRMTWIKPDDPQVRPCARPPVDLHNRLDPGSPRLPPAGSHSAP